MSLGVESLRGIVLAIAISIVLVFNGCFWSDAQATDEGLGYPTGSTLTNYALLKNNPTVNTTTASTLRTYLINHVTTFIEQSRWAPFHAYNNIGTSFVFMTEPADVLYALSLAYPYLPNTSPTYLKDSVRTYLRTEWSTNIPYVNVDYSSLASGTKRNWYQVNPADFADAISNGNQLDDFSGSTRKIQIYPIWLFAQNTDSWDLITSTVRRSYLDAALSAIPTTWSRDDSNVSRNISSVIGYIRIMDHFRSTDGDTYYNNGLSKLATLIQRKIDDQRLEGPDCWSTINNTPINSGNQEGSDGCIYASGSVAGNMIAQYYGLTPELGRILRDYAPTDSSHIATWVYRDAQGFYLTNYDTPVQEGEVPRAKYVTTMAYFGVISYIQAASFAAHFQMADMPACNADVYYVERLVRAIEASGSQNWVTYSTNMNGWPTELDTTPPVITNPLPVGSQLCTSNPRNITISIATDENATCKYNITDVAYDSMANFFAPTGTTSHSSVISLACSASYVYYCRCSDATGNKNSTSSLISFLIAAPSGGTVGGLIMGGVTR